jgi:EAL domain-containing protein (putative c-di-GMP-specific phosphodiesterase class I)
MEIMTAIAVATSAPASSAAGTTPAPRRVLLADDEPMLLRAYARLLRAAGHVVECAADGATAVAMCAGSPYDVIVSDIAMPGMDGIQFLRAVRERDLEVPVVLMTGGPDVETAAQAVEHGALRYLTKPVSGDQLRAVVLEASRRHDAARLKRRALGSLGALPPPGADHPELAEHFAGALRGLWMAYQPIVSWSRHHVFAYEALMRSQEPTLPHPGAILGAAERLGRVHELGRAIRARVAADFARGAGAAPRVFVNLHPCDLLDDSLYEPAAPLSAIAGSVTLEITERASLDAIPDLPARIAALRALGFSIAIDDLGAGYAGLASFGQLVAEVVKIDMSLVRGIAERPHNRTIVGAMLHAFCDLGVAVVAEGIETTAERDVLVELGCDLLQGYLFARPDRGFPVPTW